MLHLVLWQAETTPAWVGPTMAISLAVLAISFLGMAVAIGLAAGLLGAWALSRVLSSQLFGITTRDPVTYGAVALLLGAVALAAVWLPARRATRVDPIDTLRSE